MLKGICCVEGWCICVTIFTYSLTVQYKYGNFEYYK